MSPGAWQAALTQPQTPRQAGEVRVALMADSHGHLSALLGDPLAFAAQLKHTDLLIHAGDLCTSGQRAQLIRELQWLSAAAQQADCEVLVVPGNHDHPLEDATLRSHLPPRVRLLIGESVHVAGLHVWGGPWTDCGGRWAFDLRPAELHRRWQQMPLADLLVTHGPPPCALSRHWRWQTEFGDAALREMVLSRQPAAHLFGHIHEGRLAGTDQPGTDQLGQTLLVCGSLMHGQQHFQPVWLSLTPRALKEG